MKRAIIYCRTASAEESSAAVLEAQADQCRNVCERHGYEVIEVITEIYSGMTLERPGLSRLRELVAAGQAEVLVTLDGCRLSRNLAHLLVIDDELKKAAVAVHYAATGQLQDASTESLLTSIEAAFAEYEYFKRAKRRAKKTNSTTK